MKSFEKIVTQLQPFANTAAMVKNQSASAAEVFKETLAEDQYETTPRHTATPADDSLPPTAGEETSPHWLRLAEYGDWPHHRGLQRVSRTSAEAMVRYFKSLRGRLARKFGGIPVYIGHPDDAHFSGRTGHDDTRAYAWVTDLHARADGLYGAFKWSASGRELLANAFYKFLSPRWAMEPVGDGVFEPVRLLSVGLTNQPNIPGEAIANSLTEHTGSEDETPAPAAHTAHSTTAAPGGITAPNANTACGSTQSLACNTDAQNSESASAINRNALCAALGISNAIDPLEAIAELREQSERFYRIACDQSDSINREQNALGDERREHMELLLANALHSGRIAPHEQADWQRALEADWQEARTRLRGESVRLKTTAIANAVATQPSCTNSGDRFIRLVEEHAQQKGLTFPQAWSALKRERPELYQSFFDDGR